MPRMPLSESVQAKLSELRATGASAVVVDRLAALLTDGSDLDCFKINAFRLAAEMSVPRRDVVCALLSATRLGLFDLTWDIHCPSCGGIPESHDRLLSLRTKGHCALCALDWKLQLEDQVEVTFNVNPGARKIDFDAFSLRSFPRKMEWYAELLGREGRTPVISAIMSPGETRTVDVTLADAEYHVSIPGHADAGARVLVRGAPVQNEQALDLRVGADGSVSPHEIELAPGLARVTIHYDYVKPWGFGMHALAPIANWVSATYITSQQDFRDLFAGEFLSADASFAVRSVTLLFSDVTGSTQMYEKLGDARAYAIVQEHFGLMTEIIRRHEGGVVKTIGDAVMATFPRNADAVAAACEIQRELAGTHDPLRDVEVKIGLHRGPAIVVTSNRNVDYFGRTVNIAARTQGQAEAREVLLSDAVATDPAVVAYLGMAKLPTRVFEANVKGVAGALKLHALRPV